MTFGRHVAVPPLVKGYYCPMSSFSFLVMYPDHDPTGELNHEKKWKDALKVMKEQLRPCKQQ
ncbi:hypothetical protein OUZ56_003576 [Daphnia magna]|uniref:Uncharacterized protein n=1 Tax=Daphnia magna TaxID=35525 RepID=A0ABR0A958_9CRUS|nr:hypothetical protein OUZ56_003576 [Daphnia magna]